MTEIRGLGYLRIQTQDVARWRELVVDGLGLAVGSGPEADGLYLRLDERRARLIVLPGETDKALAVGWEVRDQFALQRVREAVEKAGVEVEVLSEVDASYRDAEQVIAFDDPNGNRVEVFFGPVLDHSPLVTPHGGRFVTGDQGLGHVVLPVTRFDEAYTFYTEVLGFYPRGAFRLPAPPEFGPLRIRFMGVNERHHSLALCPAPHGGAPGARSDAGDGPARRGCRRHSWPHPCP